jgi:hypothetical protein
MLTLATPKPGQTKPEKPYPDFPRGCAGATAGLSSSVERQ